jgi:hypothetical protein
VHLLFSLLSLSLSNIFTKGKSEFSRLADMNAQASMLTKLPRHQLALARESEETPDSGFITPMSFNGQKSTESNIVVAPVAHSL